MKNLIVKNKISYIDDEHFDIVIRYALYLDHVGYVRYYDCLVLYLHNLIFKLNNRDKPIGYYVDHKNLNNQSSNLRLADASQQQANRLVQSNNKLKVFLEIREQANIKHL